MASSLPTLSGTSPVVVGRSIPERRRTKILGAKQNTRSLRTAHAFAARVSNKRRARSQMDVGCDRLLSGRIHKHGNVLFLRDGANHLMGKRLLKSARPGKDVNHGRVLAHLRAEIFFCFYFHDLGTRHTNPKVVRIARVLGDDGLVAQLFIRHGLRTFGIGATDTGNRRKSNSSFAASGNDSAGRAHVGGNLRTHCGHQFIHLHVVVRGFKHRLFHFRQRLRAGNDGEGTPRVHDRPDTDAGIKIILGRAGVDRVRIAPIIVAAESESGAAATADNTPVCFKRSRLVTNVFSKIIPLCRNGYAF